MAWPKGKPRKPQGVTYDSKKVEERIESVMANAAKATGKAAVPGRSPRRGRPNWENYDESEDSQDRLHIGADLFPPGYDFQWVTDSVYGQPMPQHRAQFERKGWEPVHQEDFDGVFDGKFMPKGAQGEINVDGLVLMHRPLEFSIRAKQADVRKAQEAVLIKQQQLTGGDMPGISLDSRHPSAVKSNRINRTYEPVPIPRDDE